MWSDPYNPGSKRISFKSSKKKFWNDGRLEYWKNGFSEINFLSSSHDEAFSLHYSTIPLFQWSALSIFL
jgi:hypothetical protein